MSYWFRDEIEPFARPVTPRFECGDREILAWIIDCSDDDDGECKS